MIVSMVFDNLSSAFRYIQSKVTQTIASKNPNHNTINHAVFGNASNRISHIIQGNAIIKIHRDQRANFADHVESGR